MLAPLFIIKDKSFPNRDAPNTTPTRSIQCENLYITLFKILAPLHLNIIL